LTNSGFIPDPSQLKPNTEGEIFRNLTDIQNSKYHLFEKEVTKSLQA
jgi:hypothetical protein